MRLSFKFKIATMSFAVTGALLTTFGFAFFAFIYSSGIGRIDRELRSLVEAPLRGGHPTRYWEEFGNSIEFIHGEGSSEGIALMVLDPAKRILFKSDNAPAQFALLPWPEIPQSAPSQDSGRGRILLERSDTDGDGRISRQEFPGSQKGFVHHDTDNSGYLEAQELDSMPIPPPNRPGGRPRERPAPLHGREGSPPKASRFVSLKAPAAHWRVGIFRNPEIIIIAAMDMDSFNAEVDRFRNAFMVAVPLGLILLGISGWYLADRAMKPVAAIAETAEGITARGLDKRIPQVGNDIELERLVTVSNNMLDRLNKSYHQAVRFSADAAHELQTPLTILQGELDNAIQSAEDGSDEQQRYSMLLEELSNLKAVVQKLLLLSHADEGRLNLNLQPTDLSDLVEGAAEDMEIMAPGLRIEARIAAGVSTQADQALLNQTIRNMTSNAAKYADPGGKVVFELNRTKDCVLFTLANSGPPIPDEDRPLLFERFHRVDKSRTAAGSGLGLSLAREIARAHGGDLVLNPHADNMVSFTLSLPLP